MNKKTIGVVILLMTAALVTAASAVAEDNNPPQIYSFTASSETVNVGEVVLFRVGAYAHKDIFNVSFDWDFGDGDILCDQQYPEACSTIEHVYKRAGNYTITLTAKDSQDLTSSKSLNIFVPEEDGTPVIEVSPRLIETQFFVPSGCKEKNITVSNDGNASLTFSVTRNKPSFIIVNESALSDTVVLPGEKFTFPICILLLEENQGSLYVESNDPDRSVVTIDVTATAIRRE